MVTKSGSPSRSVDSRVNLTLANITRRLCKALRCETSEGAERFSAARPGSESIDPRSFNNPGRFAVNYLIDEMLSKFDDGKPSETKAATTWKKFTEAEEICASTNKRLRNGTPGSLTDYMGVSNVFHIATRKISDLLGSFCWNEAYDGMDWGPGASTSCTGKARDPAYKYSGLFPESTIGNLALAQAVITASPIWLDSLNSQGGAITIRGGNKIVTVPKNFKTDRTIAIEPDLNMYVQKGIGAMIRRRLKRVGVDLDSQSLNQDWARLGSKLENLATIDLSMASDTISQELVSQLLPLPWVEALEQCRSPVGVLPSGEIITYQKFSSMGNGFTFELESLIFWALCQGVIEALDEKDRRLAVYGDDIIISTRCVPLLVETFTYAGFKTNEKKSFASGPFRESCGKHYFRGYDVTPFYVRKPVTTLSGLFLLHNNLVRWCDRNRWNDEWDRSEMRSLVMFLRSLAPSNWRKPRLPDGYGDGAFIGTFDECTPRKASRGYDGFSVTILAYLPIAIEVNLSGLLLRSLRNLEKIDKQESWSRALFGPSRGSGISHSTRAAVITTVVQQYALRDVFN